MLLTVRVQAPAGAIPAYPVAILADVSYTLARHLPGGCMATVSICADGGKLCAACAAGENGSLATTDATDCPDDRQWLVIGTQSADPGDTCDHCGADIEPDESAEPSEPDESDYVMSDVRGGVGVSLYGKHVGTFDDRDLAEDAIREDAKQGNYWPNVWFVSDHGNAHLVTDWRWE